MTLEDGFHLFGIIFFISLIFLNVYLVILLLKIKTDMEMFINNVKRTAENVNLARYSMKAAILKTFLSFINPKGGDENE